LYSIAAFQSQTICESDKFMKFYGVLNAQLINL